MHRDLKIRGYTVGQFPNTPLWVALVAFVVAIAVPSGTIEDIARAVFYVALAVWAYEELANGVNTWRRVLGAIFLAAIVVALTRTF